MAQSNRIYDNFLAPAEQRKGYVAIEEREDMMKDLFLQRYFASQRAGERRPRVLLHFGQWHGMRGLSPLHTSSLGNFVAEFARSQGGHMLNIMVTCGTGELSGIGKEA